MKKIFLVSSLFVLCLNCPKAQTATADQTAVKNAMLDYIEGFYEGDTSKLIRSVLPEVHKYGYWKKKGSGEYTGSPMSFTEMLSYARGVKENKRFPKADAPKKAEVFEVQDQTASGKVTAWWGTDYILLGKYNGVWKIVHVLWQETQKNK